MTPEVPPPAYVLDEDKIIELLKESGILVLVILSLLGQLFLTIFGKERKRRTMPWLRFLIWAAYLSSGYIATVTLGKLSSVLTGKRILYPRILGILALVLLIHLGNPNSITAYSIEDKTLGLRKAMVNFSNIGLVVWVLVLGWESKLKLWMIYSVLFLAGFLTTVGRIWSHAVVHHGNSNVTFKDMYFYEERESSGHEEKAQGNPYLGDSARRILRAFYRFDCLKPHIPNWPYHPGFVNLKNTKIDEEDPKDVFHTTEIELSFMYDVLYTKAPILYTRLGIIGRFLIFLSLASALPIFRRYYKDVLLHDLFVKSTYAILLCMVVFDLYQTVMMLFSDWAIVKVIRLCRNRLMLRIISFVADKSIKQKKWSRRMGQLNLLKYCSKGWLSKLIGQVLWFFGMDKLAKHLWAQTKLMIPDFLEQMLHRHMKKLEEKREKQPFNKRGDWSFQIYQIQDDDIRSSSVGQGLDKSIITWHIATDMCLHQMNEDKKKSEEYRSVKMISDYMIYLMACRPELLFQTTAKVTMRYACKKMRDFLRNRTYSRAIKELSSDLLLPSMEINSNVAQDVDEMIITSKWDVLSDAQRLGKKLRALDNELEFMSSMWVEMLCYAAYNCTVTEHSKMLTYGGELITHVWLILLHNTDRYQIKDKDYILKKLVEQTKKKKKKKGCLGRMGNILGTTRHAA